MENKECLKLGGSFDFKCWRPYGIGKIELFREFFYKHGKLFHRLEWEDENHNLVVNVGLQHILDVVFAGATQVNPWYTGLTDGTPTVAPGDTMASHAGWTEITAYSESVRQTYVDVRSSQSVSNTASPASFSINGSATTGGGFLTSDSTKGGTSGTLLCAVAFTGGDRSVQSGDTVEVTYTFTAADDGS
jgi:hypothetical protein